MKKLTKITTLLLIFIFAIFSLIGCNLNYFSSNKKSNNISTSDDSNEDINSRFENANNQLNKDTTKNGTPAVTSSSNGNGVNIVDKKQTNNFSTSSPQVAVEDKSELYNLIKKNVDEGNDTVIKSKSTTLEELTLLAAKVPEENGYSGYISSYEYGSKGNTLYLHYNYKDDKDTYLSKLNKVKGKVNAVVNSIIKDGMNDFQKELAIHNYVINNCAYDYANLKNNSLPGDAFTAYGILMNQSGVCQGYSEAMYRLLNASGVKALIVTGTANGVPHAWDIAYIGGAPYQVDATFDDPISEQGQILTYNYLNLTDDEMSRDHSYNKNNYPSCNSTRFNYFVYNNLIANNHSDFYNIIKKGLQEKQKTIMCKTSKYDNNTFNPKTLFDVVSDNRNLNYVNIKQGLSYRYDPNSLVMEISVKYK
ncbi:Transglutaminase-like superfamily protein [Clostridium cavendishii DSM 21758]|uniref:Transglutaminase-like superfamily protein n=1 Tax=Clostridium cavendishii DSM 21758 TaxID=1121302 RepID=A0A1M6HVM3_9CLOT|nr:transglutaminase domain-containing protein [Clostridium cavendishii]SHJ26223.1 Transglutaminase-like superfamily protein [Clostridium cavendishii DSM 21758]